MKPQPIPEEVIQQLKWATEEDYSFGGSQAEHLESARKYAIDAIRAYRKRKQDFKSETERIQKAKDALNFAIEWNKQFDETFTN